MKASPTPCLAILLVAGGILLATVCASQAADQLVGGYSETSTTNAEVVAAAQFAVNAVAIPKHDAGMRLAGILSAQQQVVAGMNYRLRLKVKVDGTDKEAEAVVWQKLSGEHKLTSWAWEPLSQAANPDFVYTVGTDTNGVLIQQVEWLYRKADMKEQQCPIWAGSVVRIGREEDGAVCIQCDKTALPDEKKWHEFILKGNVVNGWLKRESVIKVTTADWKANRPSGQ